MATGDIVGKSEVSFRDDTPRDSWMFHKCCYELKFDGSWFREFNEAGTGYIMRLLGKFTEKCWTIGKKQSCAFGPSCASLAGFGGFSGKVCVTVQKSTSFAVLPCKCEVDTTLHKVWHVPTIGGGSQTPPQWDETGSEADLQRLFSYAILDFAACDDCF